MWNLEGKRIAGKYMGDIPVTGIVQFTNLIEGDALHYVKLDSQIEMPWRVTEKDELVVLEENHIVEVL